MNVAVNEQQSVVNESQGNVSAINRDKILTREERIKKLLEDSAMEVFKNKKFYLYEIEESKAKAVEYSPIYNWFDSIDRLSYDTKKTKINFKCICCDYSGSHLLGNFQKKFTYKIQFKFFN